MANVIKVKRGLSADLSKANLQAGEIAFTTDTKKLYISNTDEPINNNTTYAISKSGSTITLTGSDGSTSTVTDSDTKVTVDSALSSTSTNPVQNKVINAALANKANTSAIPTKTSQLTNDSGFKTTDNNTTYTLTQDSTDGHKITLTPSTGTATTITIPDNNTTYSAATTSANGLMTSAMVTKLNGIATGANKITVDSALSSTSTNPVQNKIIYAALAEKVDTNTTYSISKSGSTVTLTGSDGSTSTFTDANTTYNAATTSAAGLMSAADKTKLDGIATGANKYSHPTSSGNKHIPSGGSSGQILRWSADGTAVWGADNNTTYSAATTSAAGLMSAADKTKLDGIAANANNYILPAATTVLGGVKTTSTVTSTSGLTACPIIDGTVYYKDTNTTYSVATQSASGLMSANDKKTLDGMTATTTTPKAAGTAAVGSETKYARGDHVHPAQTTVSGNAGSATKLATARNFTIGKTAKSFNGTAAVSWTLDEIGSNVYVGTTAPTDADIDVWVDPTGSINLSALWNSIYPVGSIYMSTSSTNPGTLFTGTTWSQITDRFLVAMGTTYKTAGGTGGASSVTLATGNLPSHRHSVSITSGNQSAGHTHSIPALSGTAASAGSHNHLVTSKTTSYGSGSQSGWRCLSWTGTNADWTQNVYSGDSGAHTHSVTTTASTSGGISADHTHSVSGNTGYQGSGTAFSIIPPYYAVYMWRRTAQGWYRWQQHIQK